MVGIALLYACEPLEDGHWTLNSTIELEWQEEGKTFPEGVKDVSLNYYPQDELNNPHTFTMTTNRMAVDVPTDKYNILALQENNFMGKTNRFDYMTIELPTYINEQAEKIISENPQKMIWAGKLKGVELDFEQRTWHTITMEKVLKKLNFVVRIADTDELKEKCTVDIAGMVTKLKLHNNEFDEESEAVQIFDLIKHGRFLNTDRYLTEYRGSVYCLGAVGRNILHFTYTDARQEKRLAKYDVSQYFMDWNTTEITVAIYINADNDEVFLEGWEQGDVSDIIFNSITIIQ